MMERTEQLLEFGTATIETRGPIGPIEDFKNGMLASGLNDD